MSEPINNNEVLREKARVAVDEAAIAARNAELAAQAAQAAETFDYTYNPSRYSAADATTICNKAIEESDQASDEVENAKLIQAKRKQANQEANQAYPGVWVLLARSSVGFALQMADFAVEQSNLAASAFTAPNIDIDRIVQRAGQTPVDAANDATAGAATAHQASQYHQEALAAQQDANYALILEKSNLELLYHRLTCAFYHASAAFKYSEKILKFILSSHKRPQSSASASAFRAIPYTDEEVEVNNKDIKIIHPAYDEIKSFLTNYTVPHYLNKMIYDGYLEGCKILHGYGGDVQSYKLTDNLNKPEPKNTGSITIVSKDLTPEECYEGIKTYLQNPNNKNKITYIRAGVDGIDVGGLSRQFTNAVGTYIKQTFMKTTDFGHTSQAGGAAAAAATNNATRAPPAATCPTREKFDLSPMDFVLPPMDDPETINLAHVLAYYAFIVSRINSDQRSRLNLGINFSAFALIVLFDKTGIIEDIIYILETLSEKKTTISNDTNKTKKVVNPYFRLETDATSMPTYKRNKSNENAKEYIDIDNTIKSLIGKLYVIEELYNSEKFIEALNSKFTHEIQLHDEFFRLLIALTHTVDETSNLNSQANSDDNRIWDGIIEILLPRFNYLNLLGTQFRTFINENDIMIINSSNIPISIDLFSLGVCISQSQEISAEAIKRIIIYDFWREVSEEQKKIVQGAINQFLDDNNDDKTMLLKFLKYLTGDISLPRELKFTVISTPNPKDSSKPLDVHTCFSSIDIYNNQYFKPFYTKITNDDTKNTEVKVMNIEITDPIEKQQAIVNIINTLITQENLGFDTAGGSLTRHHSTRNRNRNRKVRSKIHHKHITLRKSKTQQRKSSKRIHSKAHNNKKSTRSKRL